MFKLSPIQGTVKAILVLLCSRGLTFRQGRKLTRIEADLLIKRKPDKETTTCITS